MKNTITTQPVIIDSAILAGLVKGQSLPGFMNRLAKSLRDAGIVLTKGNKPLKWDGDHMADIEPAFNEWLESTASTLGIDHGIRFPRRGTLSGDLFSAMSGIGAIIAASAAGSCPGIPCREGFIYFDNEVGDWAISANKKDYGNCGMLQSTASDILDAKRDIISDSERFKETHLHSYLQSSFHEDQIEMIQNWLGLHLIFGNTQAKNNQRFMMLEGDNDSNKSQLLHMIAALVGDSSVCETPVNKINPDRYEFLTGKYEYLAGKRAWLMDDVKAYRLPPEELKPLTAGGVFTVDKMMLPSYYIDMEALITMSVDRKPTLTDKYSAIARRLISIKFKKPSKPTASTGMDVAMDELDVLAAWALVGAERIIDNGYVLPIPEPIREDSRLTIIAA